MFVFFGDTCCVRLRQPFYPSDQILFLRVWVRTIGDWIRAQPLLESYRSAWSAPASPGTKNPENASHWCQPKCRSVVCFQQPPRSQFPHHTRRQYWQKPNLLVSSFPARKNICIMIMIQVLSLFCWKFSLQNASSEQNLLWSGLKHRRSFCSDDALVSENVQQNQINTSIMIDVNYQHNDFSKIIVLKCFIQLSKLKSRNWDFVSRP